MDAGVRTDFRGTTTMPYGMYVSAAGAAAQSHRLEVLSNNLANINTAGFKPHLAMLQARHSAAVEQGEVTPGQGGIDDVGGGIAIKPTETLFEQGPIQQTGNRTDFAIVDEESFFTVQRGDKQLMTRAGNFLFDSSGTLVTQNGDPVLSQGGGQITIDPRLPYEVTDDGFIHQAGTRQELGLFRPAEIGDLSRVGENLFEPLTPISPVNRADRNILRGALESSAVKPTAAMMEMIETTRIYEANVRLIQTQDESTGQLLSRVLSQ